MTLIVPLRPDLEKPFENFLSRDLVSNFFAFLDLRLSNERTKFWLALESEKIIGYLLEHDGRIINLRGSERCAAELLKMTDLAAPELNIEPRHILTANNLFEPIDPIGSNRLRINVIMAMTVKKKDFRPVANNGARRMDTKDIDQLGHLYGKFYNEMALGPINNAQIKAILDRCTKHGATYGISRDNELISFASGNSALEEIAHLAPVYTLPESRSKGYATSACSALTEELLNNRERVMLFVSEGNAPALKIYAKLGFNKTGHVFLTYRGRRSIA